MSKVNALYHIVFCTKNRQMTITNEHREHLYRFIWKLLSDNRCNLIRISGIENHLHMLINLNPTVALSNLMREIKSKSSGWMQSDRVRFPRFNGWAREYFAATVSYDNRHGVIEYIKNQQTHHKTVDFDAELKSICQSENMSFCDADMI